MKPSKTSQQGSIFTVMLTGVAMVAVLGMVLYQNLAGPVGSMSRAAENTQANTQINAIARAVIFDAIRQSTSSDCDADGFIEPPPFRTSAGDRPTNGGLIPTDMGVTTRDPWGVEYGYCVWDTGPTSAAAGCNSGTGYLDGANDPSTGQPVSQTVIALISAGPDREFDTNCNTFTTGSANLLTNTSDDIIKRYTYDEMIDVAPNLWVVSPTSATSAENVNDRDLEVGSDISIDTSAGFIQSASLVSTDTIFAGGGLQVGTQTTITACNSSVAGLIRYNTATDRAQVCSDSSGSYQFQSLAYE